MKFTGRNLQWVKYAMELAVDEIHNQIATCPNIFEHETAIEELEQQQGNSARSSLASTSERNGPTDTFNPNKGEE